LEEKTGPAAEQYKSELIQRMLHILPDVMTNQFGNYLCQKMFEVACDDDIRKLMNYVLAHSFQVSASMHGTRAM
jgi:hypothetical protein